MGRISEAFAEDGVAGREEEGAKTAEEKKEVEHGSLGRHGLVPLDPKAIRPAIKPRWGGRSDEIRKA
jgi:hypothetical protein